MFGFGEDKIHRHMQLIQRYRSRVQIHERIQNVKNGTVSLMAEP